MRQSFFRSLAVASLVSLVTAQSPVVDLGYLMHEGNLDSTGSFYNFSNVRYAAPPTGQNRFQPPQPPSFNRTHVKKGNIGRMCPQANPAWFEIMAEWIPVYKPGQPVNVTKKEVNALKDFPEDEIEKLTNPDPRITEDCLFLDVLVPEKVFATVQTPNSRIKGRQTPPTYPTSGGGAPVLVWIYGGGYTSGDKTDYSPGTSPYGLIKASQADGSNGAIFVAINYRLGVFGWASGSTIQSDGVANAGLLDQAFALQWVQTYIHLFGGDPTKVTVMGESAGGGSIMHHITANGGQGTPPAFQQAIVQSPAFVPFSSPSQSEAYFQAYLQLAGLSSLEDARSANTTTLMLANALQIARSQYGSYTYGPVIDGTYVPSNPGALLAQGKFHSNINVMAAHNADEGLLFANPTVEYSKGIGSLLAGIDPNISEQQIQEVTEQLYPANYTGEFGYIDGITRQATAVGDLVVDCNVNYLANAYKGNMFSYIFAVPPALHSQDVPYTFYDGSNTVGGVLGEQQIDAVVAAAFQSVLSSFVTTGSAYYGDANGTVTVERYGSGKQVLLFNVTGTVEVTDPTNAQRCAFWQGLGA